MANESLRETFFQECEDLLEVMNDGFALMDEGEGDAECVNAVFRAVHSIKGGAGAFGFKALVAFAHTLENLLDDLRAGRVADSGPVMPVLLRAGDRLADLVEAERSGAGAVDHPDHEALLEELAAACAGGAKPAQAAPVEDDDLGFVPMTLSLDPLPGLDDIGGPGEGLPPLDLGAASRTLRIRFAPRRELYASGNDPVPLIRSLAQFGAMQVQADLSALPEFDTGEWDNAYLAWDITIETEASPTDVMEVFEFVCDDADLVITVDDPEPPSGARSPANEQELAQDPAAEGLGDVGEDNVVVPIAVAAQARAAAAGAGQSQTTTPAAARLAKDASSAGAAGAAAVASRQSIRVDLDRVDRLINLVGELVISEAMLSQSLTQSGGTSDPRVTAALGQMKQLSNELQERIMAIRAQSVKSLFQRMARIAREAAAAADREVRLVAEGEATEVDKTVIERLADPLTHMLRNSVDHGIEPPALREAAGKPRIGTVTLSAAHRSGQVVIEIADDGAGIDRDAVLAKAVERGLVSPDAELSDMEIFNLLFEPGFSTARTVSKLSGRGVGMDVVRTEIQALGGRVTIASVKGAGTTVSISLPLTLAVVEGMLVEVAGETLVVPSTALRETMRAGDSPIHRLGASDPVLSTRGGLIPVIDLGACLGYRRTPPDLTNAALLLVESFAGKLVALTVDRIIGQREVVIKGLNENYGHVPGIAAATILGDGRIALIIDIDQVARPDGPSFDSTAQFAAMGA